MTIYCNYSSDQKITYLKWNRLLPMNTQHEINQTTPDLVIQNIKRENAGQYVCTVSNLAGNGSDNVTVQVNCKSYEGWLSWKNKQSYSKNVFAYNLKSIRIVYSIRITFLHQCCVFLYCHLSFYDLSVLRHSVVSFQLQILISILFFPSPFRPTFLLTTIIVCYIIYAIITNTSLKLLKWAIICLFFYH